MATDQIDTEANRQKWHGDKKRMAHVTSERAMRMATQKIKVGASEKGLPCPSCAASGARVIDSRTRSSARWIARRRVCVSCDHRFTTYESAEHPVKSAEIANIRTAHLDELIGRLKEAIEEYEHTRMHPTETWAEPLTNDHALSSDD